MKIYGIYTQRFIEDGNFTENSSLNGYYDLSFFLDYPSYKLPTLKVIDGILTNSNKRIFIAEYDENIISQEIIDIYISNIPTDFNIQILKDPIQWIRENTNFLEDLTTPGKFEISSAGIGINGEPTEPQYLIID